MKCLLISCAVVVALLTGCAATPATQSKASYVASGFNRASIESGKLSLLPVVAGAGVEGYRRPFGDAINKSAASSLPNGTFLPWQETMQRLNDANLVEDYQQAISAYASTSIVPRRLIQAMSKATGTKYFLYVSLNSPVNASRQRMSAWGGGTATDTKIGVSASGQVWDANGDVVWEGIGASEVSASTDAFQVISEEDRSLEGHSTRAANALFKAAIGETTAQ